METVGRKLTTAIEFLDHTADIGIQITAHTLEELLEEAARGMNQILIDPASVTKKQTFSIIITGPTPADLLVNWLRELLFLHNDRYIVYNDFHVVLDSFNEQNIVVHGIVHGEPIDPVRHSILTEIKLVTYHQLAVIKKDSGWEGQVIFDI